MKYLTVCVLMLSVVTKVTSKGCALPVETSNEERMPVLVDNSTSKFKLVYPREGKVELDKGEYITLICPNARNTLNLTHTNSTLAKCVQDETVEILKKREDFQGVTCKNGVRGTAVTTDDSCGNGAGYIINIGFPTPKNFLTIIEVCYDGLNGNTFYSTHDLYGSEINYASKSSYRPSFSTAELPSGVAANVAYRRVYEKSNLNKLLGSAKLADKYINSTSFLARGHLAPDADFIFASWQYATYFYVNAAPQWQQINNGNWKRLENISKQTANALNEDLKVYTGTYDTLELPNVKNVNTKIIMLDNGMLAVPKFIWKILYSEKSRSAIAFISLNNPFAEKLETRDKLCTDICDRYGWDNPRWTQAPRGLIYCCDARDLLGVISTGPKLKISGVLKAPMISFRFLDEDDAELWY